MKRFLLVAAVFALLSLPDLLWPQDVIFPSGYSVVSYYEVSDFALSTQDTLTISRSLANNESFPLIGLYFSENLPPEFEILSYLITLNGSNISQSFQEFSPEPIIPGFRAYYWVFHDPFASDSVQNEIDPGDSVALELRLICSTSGEYLFPFHTTVFYGNGTGFFATGDSTFLEVHSSCGDLDASGQVNLLDIILLIRYIYSGGEAPDPPESADINNDGRVNLHDILNLIRYLYKGGPEPPCQQAK